MRQIVNELQSIDTLQNKLTNDLNKTDINLLEKEISQYITAIKAVFEYLPTQQLDHQCLQDLEILISRHQQLARQFENERSNISGELRKIKRGKMMQETYPNL